jgi:hypothetical protein
MNAPATAPEGYQAMEFSVTKSALLNELSTTQGVVERKTTIPVSMMPLLELPEPPTGQDVEFRESVRIHARSEQRATVLDRMAAAGVGSVPAWHPEPQTARPPPASYHERTTPAGSSSN